MKVQIENHNGRLRLRWDDGNKVQTVAVGLPDSPINRKFAVKKNEKIERDWNEGEYDFTVVKYRAQTLGKNATEISAPELFQRFADYQLKHKGLSVSSTDKSIITCKNTSEEPNGWKKLKDTSDGGGVFKPIDRDDDSRTYYPEHQQPEVKVQYHLTDHQTRNRILRCLILKNGSLSSTYREEFRRRGLSDRSIDRSLDRGWFANWQSGIPAEFISATENIAGIDPNTGLTCSWEGMFLPATKDGQIVGGQIYPRPHIDRKLGRSEDVPEGLGKYTWLSSSRKGGVNAHCFDTGENPLFLHEHPDSKSEEVENLNQCEGALKSAIALLKFEERGQLDPWLGAAGGTFSPKELSQCLNKYPNLKTVTLYPDAGSLHNPDIIRRYRSAIASIEKLTAGRVKVLIAWWGQHTKNEDRDVDEMTETDLENLTIESYGNSIMAEAEVITDEIEDSPEATNQLPHFKSSIEDGLICVGFEKDKKVRLTESEEWIGNHLNAIAYVNNLDRDGAALHLEFKTIKKDIRYWTMLRADLAGDGSAIVAGLLSRDYSFKRKHKSSLLDYIHSLGSEVEQTYVVTDSSGWVQKSFVLPHKTHGDRNLKFRDVEPSPDVMTEIVGSLDGWINTVAIGCAGNSRLILALGASFAAPLLHIPAIPDGSNYGCFETIHGAETAAQFVTALDAAVKQHHGTALDAFVSQLVIDAADPDFAGTLSKQVHLLAAKISEGKIDSAIGRVAKRFAVVQVALGIAHKYGLLPFPKLARRLVVRANRLGDFYRVQRLVQSTGW